MSRDVAREQAEVLSDGLKELGYGVRIFHAASRTARGMRGISVEVSDPVEKKTVATFLVDDAGRVIIEREVKDGIVSALLNKIGLRERDVDIIDRVTPVLFRVWKKSVGGVIALFPTEPGGGQGRSVQSYEHVGQHGTADIWMAIAATRPATEEEYAPLKRELEQIGYALKVYKATASWMYHRLNEKLARR